MKVRVKWAEKEGKKGERRYTKVFVFKRGGKTEQEDVPSRTHALHEYLANTMYVQPLRLRSPLACTTD